MRSLVMICTDTLIPSLHRHEREVLTHHKCVQHRLRLIFDLFFACVC